MNDKVDLAEKKMEVNFDSFFRRVDSTTPLCITKIELLVAAPFTTEVGDHVVAVSDADLPNIL